MRYGLHVRLIWKQVPARGTASACLVQQGAAQVRGHEVQKQRHVAQRRAELLHTSRGMLGNVAEQQAGHSLVLRSTSRHVSVSLPCRTSSPGHPDEAR